MFQSDWSVEDCARWICFLRAYCAIYGPVKIYSFLPIPRAHTLSTKLHAVSPPEYISNILCDYIDLQRVRYARELPSDRHCFMEDHFLYKPQLAVLRRSVVAYRMRPSLVLGDELMEICARSLVPIGEIKETCERLAIYIARAYNGLGLHEGIEASALLLEEVRWLRRYMRQERLLVPIRYDN